MSERDEKMIQSDKPHATFADFFNMNMNDISNLPVLGMS